MMNPELHFQNYIVFPIGGALRLLHIPPFYNKYKDITKLKDIHKGKRIFIVATGPSLTVEDVELLEKEITIGVNTIFDIYSMTNWRPDYYFAGDFKGIRLFDDINVDELATQQVIFSHKYFGKLKTSSALYVPMCWLDHWYNYEKTNDFRYSDNLLWGMYCLMNATATAINLATYMGANEVVLIGCDNDYSGKEHFVENGMNSNNKKDLSFVNRQYIGSTRGFEFVKRETQKRNCQVINATRGGKLEVFERKKLEEILNS